jgi:hypothetical protein
VQALPGRCHKLQPCLSSCGAAEPPSPATSRQPAFSTTTAATTTTATCPASPQQVVPAADRQVGPLGQLHVSQGCQGPGGMWGSLRGVRRLQGARGGRDVCHGDEHQVGWGLEGLEQWGGPAGSWCRVVMMLCGGVIPAGLGRAGGNAAQGRGVLGAALRIVPPGAGQAADRHPDLMPSLLSCWSQARPRLRPRPKAQGLTACPPSHAPAGGASS